MSQDIPLPRFDEDIEEGELATWLKRPGDRVEVGDVIAEIVTEKANVEVEAPAAGEIEALLVEEGARVTVGQPIVRLRTT